MDIEEYFKILDLSNKRIHESNYTRSIIVQFEMI